MRRPSPPITASEWPWYALSNLTRKGLPVAARATRTALIAASVPEVQKRIRSIEGIRSRIIRASRTSARVVTPKGPPAERASCTAATTAGWA